MQTVKFLSHRARNKAIGMGKFEFDYIKSIAHLKTWTEDFLAGFDDKPKRFAYDTETTSLSVCDLRIIGLSIYDGDRKPMYVQFNFKTTVEDKKKDGRKTVVSEVPFEYTKGIDFEEARPYLEQIFADAEAITANGKFDTKVLKAVGLPLPRIVGDCNMAAYLYDNTFKGGLKDYWQHYMKEKTVTFEEVTGMRKGKIDWRQVDFFEFGKYGAKDAYMTYVLEAFLKTKLADMKLTRCYENLELPLIPEVAETEFYGVKIDLDFLDAMAKRLREEIATLEATIYGLMGCKINLNSGKQLGQVLFDQLRLPVMGYTDKGERSTDEAALKNLAYRGHGIATAILRYRKAMKLLGTYAEGIRELVDPDGRVRGNFNQGFTDTGRFSCVAGDTLLTTDKGLLRIGDLIPDRPGGYELPEGNRPQVLTHEGRYQEITHAINKGQEMMYEVELEDGKKIQCTENHKFLTNLGWLILKDILSTSCRRSRLRLISYQQFGGQIHNHSSERTRMFTEVGIKSIRPVGIKTVCDITVANDHSYVGNGIVSHNSSGPNLQNIPNDKKWPIKEAFVAGPGRKLIVVDWCLAEGTEVITSEGAKPIEMCKPGDLVIQEDGTYRKVLSVPARGKKPCVRIVTNCGYEVIATREHRFRVITETGDYVWKQVKDIDTENDYIVIQPTDKRPGGSRLQLPGLSYTHYNNKEIKVTPSFLDEELAFLLGYLTGDGHVSKNRHISWVVNENDHALADYLCDSFERLFGDRPTFSQTRNGCHHYYFNSIPLMNWLKFVGLSKDTVPELLMFSDIDVVKAWLKGYFEADGHGGRSISVCSSRVTLIKQVQKLLLQVGIFTHYKEQPNGDFIKHVLTVPTKYTKKFLTSIGFFSDRKTQNCIIRAGNSDKGSVYGSYPNLATKVEYEGRKDLYRLLQNIRLRNTVVTTQVAEKLAQLDADQFERLGLYRITQWGQVYDRVAVIEEDGEYETFDLEVEETNSFIANGFVSHNSNIEVRVMAHESGDPVLTELFNTGGDMHSNTMKMVKELTGIDLPRTRAKRVNFGVLYGMWGESLANSLNFDMLNEVLEGKMTQDEFKNHLFSPEQGQQLVDSFYAAYKGFTNWSKAVVEETKKKRYARSMSGRIRRIPDAHTSRGARQAVNFIIQGGAADLMKLGIIKLADMYRGKRYDAKTVMYVHDEYIIDVAEHQAEECFRDVVRELSQIQPHFKVPIVVEGGIYDSWNGLKGGGKAAVSGMSIMDMIACELI